jgi:hypothetical protein
MVHSKLNQYLLSSGQQAGLFPDKDKMKQLKQEGPPSMLSHLSSSGCQDAEAGSALGGRFFPNPLRLIISENPLAHSKSMFDPLTAWRRLRRWTMCLELPSIRVGG